MTEGTVRSSPTPQTLLVSFVPTDAGADAVALGRLLARASTDRLVVCSVAPQTASGGDAGFGGRGYGDLVVGQLQPAYEQVKADLAPVEAEFTVRFAGSVAVGLLDYAAELGATMLVLGSARSGLSGRYAIGSLAGLLQHSSPVPLAFAPDGFAEVRVETIRRVACAYNDSPDSRQALELALELCRAHQVPLQLVTFVFPEYPHLRQMPGLSSLADDRTARAAAADQLLAEVADGLPDDIEVETCVRTGGNIAQAVARAEWRDGDVLVLGSAPMGPFARVFLGSTALKLLRCCPVPVIAVPRPDQPDATTPASDEHS
ncbi:MAG: universal stress protein [Humibacillus sp.]|nr:universal stress protein [Humibacillus sp.]MDN5777397.1 universal stress protein [Humibacillus sp.]